MPTLTRALLTVGAAAALALPISAPAGAAPFPEVIGLPEAWNAEGIATGPGHIAWSGSLATGAIYRADLRTGAGSVLVPPTAGRVSVGLKQSRGLLYVAGGPTGQAYVYDAATGAEVAVRQLGAPGGSFVNDVVVTEDAAWFTDSFNPVLYRLPIEGGRPNGDPLTVPLTGDWVQIAGFNANGIEATPSGNTLLVIHSTLGALFTVDPTTGVASRVETTATLTSGDGILLRGHELAVVRNRLNEVALLRLSPDLGSATLTAALTDPDFAVPTTVADFGGTLYAVNARFGLPAGPFSIVRVDGS